MKQRNSEKIELLSSEQLLQSSAAEGTGQTVQEDGQQLPVYRKLGIPIVVFMIIGKVVGAGIIWFPKALSDAGWFGFIVLGISLATSVFTGILLARSWLVLMQWFPAKYRDEINRHPYPSIGYETFGDLGRRVIAILIGIYGFGFTVALYLVAADNVRLFFHLLDVRVPLCVWIPALILASAPLMWFGTPKDMVAVGIVLASTTVVSALALVIGSLLDNGVYKDAEPVSPTFSALAGSLGLIMGSFGGQFVIPTLHHDMKNPQNMPVSALLGYLGIGLIYFLIGLPTYLVYGNAFGDLGVDNVLALVTTRPLQIIILLFLSVHLIVGSTFLSNPLFQEVEDALNIPYDVTWKRILLRSCYSLLVLLVAVSVPSFPVYMSIVGGALAAVVNFIVPSVLFLKLCRVEPPPGAKPEGPLRWYLVLAICTVIVVAFSAGLLSSISGVYGVLRHASNVTLPCYVRPQ